MTMVRCECGDIVPIVRDRYLEDWRIGDHGCEFDGGSFFDSQMVPDEPAPTTLKIDIDPAATRFEYYDSAGTLVAFGVGTLFVACDRDKGDEDDGK